MPTIDEQLIASISQEVSTPQPTSVMEQAPVATHEPAAAPVMSEVAPTGEQPAEPEAKPTTEQPAFDANKWVDEITGGMFKDVDAFKQSLPKLSEYDKLKTERDTFEAKTKENPFASDYVKILNDLVSKGATVDQLNNFQKINAIGDINTLSPIDAKVAKLVLIDGYKESVARKMVDKDYPITDYDDGSDEKEILEEKLRVDSNTDKAALAQYKAQTSTVTNPAEDVQLQTLAQKAQHETYVKSTVPNIASQINGMGELSFKNKDGVEQGKLKFDYPAEFKAQIGDKLTEYFMDGQTPINNETVQEAFKTINAYYLDENFPVISQRIWDSAYAKATEDAINKYENKSGLPKSPEVQVSENSNADYNKFLNGLVGKK
jgi:hypothetical protein